MSWLAMQDLHPHKGHGDNICMSRGIVTLLAVLAIVLTSILPFSGKAAFAPFVRIIGRQGASAMQTLMQFLTFAL